MAQQSKHLSLAVDVFTWSERGQGQRSLDDGGILWFYHSYMLSQLTVLNGSAERIPIKCKFVYDFLFWWNDYFSHRRRPAAKIVVTQTDVEYTYQWRDNYDSEIWIWIRIETSSSCRCTAGTLYCFAGCLQCPLHDIFLELLSWKQLS